MEGVLRVESEHSVTLSDFAKPSSTHRKMRTMALDEVVGVVKMMTYMHQRQAHTYMILSSFHFLLPTDSSPSSLYFPAFPLAVTVIQCLCCQAVVPGSRKAELDVFTAVSALGVGVCGVYRLEPHPTPGGPVGHLSWSSGGEEEPAGRPVPPGRRWPASGTHSSSDISFFWE